MWKTPLLATVAGAGLVIVSLALLLSRSEPGSNRAELLFWLGLLTIFLPCALVAAGRNASRGERVAALLFLGTLFYLVKVVHDPFTFTYSDEWVHAYNAEQILRTGTLFHSNPIIAITTRYPGLEATTAGIAAMTGLSVYVSGLILVGAARLVVVFAIFHLLERLTASARLAGLAAVVYTTNPNFLFWSAQFSYESLALPLVILAILAALAASGAGSSPTPSAPPRRRGTAERLRAAVQRVPVERIGWMLVAMCVIAAVVATHHVSALVLSGTLIGLCLIASLSAARRRQAPWILALFATGGTLAWLLLVASQTIDYLQPVLSQAFHQAVDAAQGRAVGRTPFSRAPTGGSGLGATPPLWQRVVAIASVLVIVVAVPFGLREVWRRFWENTYAIGLGIAGLLYILVLPLRLLPAAWETSSRTSEFLFVGVALLVALAATHIWSRTRAAQLIVPGCLCILLVGGIVAGWPPRVLLARPYRVKAESHVIVPQNELAARVSRRVLGAGNRFIASEGDGRVMLLHGRQTAYVTSAPFGTRVIFEPAVTASVAATLLQERIRYVEINRLLVGNDNMAAYFFPPPNAVHLNARAVSKYDGYPGVDRVIDTGEIAVYNVERLSNVPR